MSGSLARAITGKRLLTACKYRITDCHRFASSSAAEKADINTADSRLLDQLIPLPRPQPSAPSFVRTKYKIKHYAPRKLSVKGTGKPVEPVTDTEDLAQQIISHPAASIVLRDACKCSKCKDSSTRQRNFNIADIPTNLRASEATKDAQDNWTVRWENDIPGWEDHVSIFTPDQLARLNNYMVSEHFVPTDLWDKQTFEQQKFSISYDKYMNSDLDLAKALYFFSRHGLIFIKDVPKEESSVKLIAQRIAAVKSTFYGETWDVRSIPDAKNVAYTSQYLGFHSDLLYTKEPPTVQYLHCLENSATGGESRFVDQFKAFDTLYSEDEEAAKCLPKIRLRYEYENDGFYYSDIKPLVQLKTSKYQFPKRQFTGYKSERIKDIYRMFWSPPFLGSILAPNTISKVSKVYTEQNIRAMKRYTGILERDDLVYEEKMEPGTCVMFDNLRVLHARNEFDMNSGSRWLRGAYLNGEDLWSKEMELKEHITRFQQEMGQPLLETTP